MLREGPTYSSINVHYFFFIQGGENKRDRNTPATKLIPGKIHIPPRLISRIKARIQLMRLGHGVGQHAVHMSGELLETGLGAVEAMDVDEEQSAFRA